MPIHEENVEITMNDSDDDSAGWFDATPVPNNDEEKFIFPPNSFVQSVPVNNDENLLLAPKNSLIKLMIDQTIQTEFIEENSLIKDKINEILNENREIFSNTNENLLDDIKEISIVLKNLQDEIKELKK